MSTVMERMIQMARHAEELMQLNAGISAFYDALPDAVVTEHAAWGEVGTAGLAAFVEAGTDQISREPKPKRRAR